MTDAQYHLGTHLDVADLIPQLTRLSNIAFADYDPIMPVDEAFMEWYLERPGCAPELCTAAVREGKMVSNVLVTLQDLQLGGETLPCGIVDTVGTDPAHRRRGLARRLMEDAHRRMQAAGAEAAVLYTNPDGHPYLFYQRLGYELRATAAALTCAGPLPRSALRARPAEPGDAPAIRGLLDRYHAAYEGYAPLTDDLWRWHRAERPAGMPLHLLVIRDRSGDVSATACFAELELRTSTGTTRALMLNGFAAEADEAACLDAFLAAAPLASVAAITDVRAPVHDLLVARGFEQAAREVAMVLPFSARARAALARRGAPWFVMVESVVGV